MKYLTQHEHDITVHQQQLATRDYLCQSDNQALGQNNWKSQPYKSYIVSIQGKQERDPSLWEPTYLTKFPRKRSGAYLEKAWLGTVDLLCMQNTLSTSWRVYRERGFWCSLLGGKRSLVEYPFPQVENKGVRGSNLVNNVFFPILRIFWSPCHLCNKSNEVDFNYHGSLIFCFPTGMARPQTSCNQTLASI